MKHLLYCCLIFATFPCYAQLPGVVLSQIATSNASNKGNALSATNYRRSNQGTGQDMVKLADGTYYCVVRAGTGTLNRPYLFRSTNGGSTWGLELEVSTTGAGSNLVFASSQLAYDPSTNKIHITWSGEAVGAWYHRDYDLDTATLGTLTTFTTGIYPPACIATNRQGKLLTISCSNSDPSTIEYAYFNGSSWSGPTSVPGSSESAGPVEAAVAYSSIDDFFYALVAKNAAGFKATEYWKYDYGSDTWTDISSGNSPFGTTVAIQPPVGGASGQSNLVSLVADKNGELYAVMAAASANTDLYFNKTTGGTWGTKELYNSAASDLYPNPTVGVLDDGSIYVTRNSTSSGTPEVWRRTGAGSFSSETVGWTGNGYHALSLGREEAASTAASAFATLKAWRRRLLWR